MTSDSTVFIVDDDEDMRRSISRIVSSVGMRATCFESPEDFLSQHDTAAPGCAVLDVRMPGMSGFELFDRLCSQRHKMPVIFISA